MIPALAGNVSDLGRSVFSSERAPFLERYPHTKGLLPPFRKNRSA